jgi:DNA polymerase
MTILWLDFETRSRCDLFGRGVYNYAQDISTDVLCMSYAFDDGDVLTWRPAEPDMPSVYAMQPFPQAIIDHIKAGGQIRAHNAAFERLIFWYVLCPEYGVPEPALEQFYCTATQARANCLPGSLEDVGRALSSKMRKDHRGSQLIRLLSIPLSDGTFGNDPALMDEMVAYCEQDVRAMREISKAMRPLSDIELADYHVNERINDRGILVDEPLCAAAVQYAEDERGDIETLVNEITHGEITSVRSPRMRQWVQDRVGPEALKLMTVHKDGVPKVSIDKTVRANLLLLAEENPDEVPSDVADVIQCADDLWASSVAKFKRLAGLADAEDSRVRGAFVFAGGSATGRASSYGAQLHNFTRKCAKDPEAVRESMVRGHSIAPKHGRRVTDVLKSMLRPAVIPAKGNLLIVSDWSSIEARVNPWLAQNPAGERKLADFRKDLDAYIVNAAATFSRPYADILADYERDGMSDQRQIGKVQELACGFAGGAGAFAAMGRAYGILLPETQAKRMVDAWRKANPWAVEFWSDLEMAYHTAMRNKNRAFTAGRITYMFDGRHLWYALPSGRVLCYPFARLEKDEITYLKAAWKPSQTSTEWPRARLWRGLACENVTQAVANDMLRYALRRLPDVIAHVHDEIVIECAGDRTAEVSQVMCNPPEWANGLPLGASVKIMERYGK